MENEEKSQSFESIESQKWQEKFDEMQKRNQEKELERQEQEAEEERIRLLKEEEEILNNPSRLIVEQEPFKVTKILILELFLILFSVIAGIACYIKYVNMTLHIKNPEKYGLTTNYSYVAEYDVDKNC